MTRTVPLIRHATVADAPAIAEVHVRSWQAAYADLLPAAYLQGLQQTLGARAAYWRDALEQGAVELLLAEREGRVLGWSSFGASRDNDAEPATGELWALYVLAEHWSSGVGRALWLEARRRLQEAGHHSVTLWVLRENGRAIRFYRAAGFSAEAHTEKELQRGGRTLREVRYRTRLDG